MCICARMQSSASQSLHYKDIQKDVPMSFWPFEVEVTHIQCAHIETHNNLNQIMIKVFNLRPPDWGVNMCKVMWVTQVSELENESTKCVIQHVFSVLCFCSQPKSKLYHAKSAETNHQVSIMESLRVRDVRWDLIHYFVKACFVCLCFKIVNSIMQVGCKSVFMLFVDI